MNPRFIFNYRFNNINCYVKSFCQLFFGYNPRNVGFSNCICNFLGYCCSSVVFSFVISSFESTLGNRVLSVFLCGSRKQMERINATARIALVKNEMPIGYNSKVQKPRSDVCSPTSFSGCKRTIGPFVFLPPPFPQPAMTKFRFMFWDCAMFINLFPKSLHECFGISLRSKLLLSKCWLHNQSFWLCRAPGVSARRGISIYSPKLI